MSSIPRSSTAAHQTRQNMLCDQVSRCDNHECLADKPPPGYAVHIRAFIDGKPHSLDLMGPNETERATIACDYIEGQGFSGSDKKREVIKLMETTWGKDIEAAWPEYQTVHFAVSRHTTAEYHDSIRKPDANKSSVGCLSALTACYKRR